VGGIWNSLESWARERIKSHKENLKGNSGKNTKSKFRDRDTEGYGQEASDGTKGSTENWIKDQSFYP
jgi:hypothetical protein